MNSLTNDSVGVVLGSVLQRQLASYRSSSNQQLVLELSKLSGPASESSRCSCLPGFEYSVPVLKAEKLQSTGGKKVRLCSVTEHMLSQTAAMGLTGLQRDQKPGSWTS